MRDDNASHWLTLSLYTGLLLAFLLAACVSAAWPHLHPSSVEILAPTATTVQLELVFAAADAVTLVALAPAGLRRDAAARLRDALRAVPGAIRWRVRVSARQAVLPSAGEEEALLATLQGTPANATVMPKGAYDSEDFWDTRSKLA